METVKVVKARETLEVLLSEARKLWDEQHQRMRARDSMLNLTLVAVGTVASFAVSGPNNYYALLLIPWLCAVFGVHYALHDQKVSQIGLYIRECLAKEVEPCFEPPMTNALGFETWYRKIPGRIARKRWQFAVDFFIFVAAGIVALVFFCVRAWPSLTGESTTSAVALWVLVIVESMLLMGVFTKIFLNADLKKGS